MHEYSVVASLIDIVLAEAKRQGADSVLKAIVSVGQRSNIEKTLLVSAFEALKVEYEILEKAEIVIITEEILFSCKDCDHSFHSLQSPICPLCGSKNTEIVKGREIRLESLELELP